MMTVIEPTLDVERDLHRAGVTWVVGCDEVGRGAIAGPVAVGLSAVLASVAAIPQGLRDSKLLSEKRREQLYPQALEWSAVSAVGLADADEVDRIGIIKALGLAGHRALVQLHDAGVDVLRSVVVLDGNYDYLTPALSSAPRVLTRIKADRDCGSVAAASVIAKVHRDRLMIGHDAVHPGYGWSSNKGYGSTTHYEALQALGPSPLHRLTWLH